jgi:hypothetical protein
VEAPWEEVQALEREAEAKAKAASAAMGGSGKSASVMRVEGAAATVAPLWNMGE